MMRHMRINPGPLRRLRGTWRPGRTNGALFVIEIVATVQALIRGLDYYRQPEVPQFPPPTPGTLTVEQSLPFLGPNGSVLTWATAFSVSAVIVITGLLLHRAVPIMVGHGALAATYAGLGVYFLGNAADNVRTGSGLIFAGVIHGALCIGIAALVRRQRITESQSLRRPTGSGTQVVLPFRVEDL